MVEDADIEADGSVWIGDNVSSAENVLMKKIL